MTADPWDAFDPEQRAGADERIDKLRELHGCPEEQRFEVFAELGLLLGWRYGANGDQADLDEALASLCTAGNAPAPPGAEPAWIDVEVARLLVIRADAAGSLCDAEAAIAHAESALAALAPPVDGPDRDFALLFHVLGVAHAQRVWLAPGGAREDLRLAADAFRRSLALLPPSDAGARGEVTARLGVVLAAELCHGMDHLGDAVWRHHEAWTELGRRTADTLRVLEAGWSALPADDPYRPLVRYWLGIMRTLRFTALGGGTEDQKTALADFEACLELPGRDDGMADACHVYIAILHLTGLAPDAFRMSGKAPSLDNFARFLATVQTAPPEAMQLALDHLDQVTGPTYDSVLPSLRLMAEVGSQGSHQAGDRLRSMLPDLMKLPEEVTGKEFRGFASLLGEVQRLRDGSGSLDKVAGSFTRFVDELGDAHPLRPVLRGMLGQLLDATAGRPDRARPASREERDAAFELLERVLRELPDGHPERASSLVRLANTLMLGLEDSYSPDRVTTVRDLLVDAIARPAADRENEAMHHFLLVLMDCCLELGGNDTVPELKKLIERLQRAVALAPPAHRIRTLSLALLAMVFTQRFRLGDDLEHLDAAAYYARTVSQAIESGDVPGGETAVLMDWLLAVIPLAREDSLYDADRLSEITGSMRERIERIPEEDRLRRLFETDLQALELVRDLAGLDGPDLHALRSDPRRFTEAVDALVAKAGRTSRDSSYYPIEMGIAGNAKVGSGFVLRDVRILDEGLAMVSDAYLAAHQLRPLRPWLLTMLGGGLVMRYEITRDRADLSNAIDRMEEARRADEDQPPSRRTALNLSQLAAAYRFRGDMRLDDRRRVGEMALASVRASAWGVMLQTSTERAFDAAIRARGEAAEMALLCVAAGLVETAVEALEWGRAMVLHAATTETGLPDLLRDGDHDLLATEWEATSRDDDLAPWDVPDEAEGTPGRYARLLEVMPELRPPSDLRQRVMAAIEGTETERRVFNAATVEEIAAELREAGAAALVYLVSHPGWRGGLALVVHADGQVSQVQLLKLGTTVQTSRLNAFVEAQHDREQAQDEDAAKRAHDQWAHALGELCDWAWTAVMEVLLREVTGGSSGHSRTPRLILVPVGELGAIPWHAARRTVGSGLKRYACQDAVLSYAASARQFVDARRRQPRRWVEDPALVLVRGGNLYWAAKEIEHNHARHYRTGELLGGRRRGAEVPPGRPATGENVLSLLPGPRSGGATLLHLGCHARATPRPVDSYLLLAGGERLGMTGILRQARSRPADVSGGLVVLAACGSDLTSRHHDEALTLATAFLAAGATGVVGTRWPVRDFPTSMLMIMFHHYLNSGYDDPIVALRAAQLWMLDPRRRVPGHLPADVVALLEKTPVHEPDSWAAFTYQGR
ncbi:CHAT domain-containing protein [Nonomuraea lactucae]|uniref:CHAT domain-containing protein n=1 Tax=Nonomuraea lactucae TaxID=2249762 RepID=UPI000DE26041|nr:CHAT domain-containing protein [Nonomuraea lactucae]